ncbi:MAG: hypothetical protein ACRD07_18595 [Acidimicrobiales bacterium]
MAGAARPVACAVHLIPTGIAAPMHEHTWLQASTDKPVSADFPVFTNDRLTRRLSERFP